MIQKDNEAACVGLMQLGAALKVSTVVPPRLEQSNYPSMEVAGDTDGLAFGLKDVGSAKPYRDINTAIKASSTPEVTKSILTLICAMVMSSMATAARADFKSAMDHMAEGAIAKKDVTDAFHWVAARTHGQWNAGAKMAQAERSQWLAWDRPFKF